MLSSTQTATAEIQALMALSEVRTVQHKVLRNLIYI